MEDTPATADNAPPETAEGIVADYLLGLDNPEKTPAEIAARAARILEFAPSERARSLAHAIGLTDQSLAERGVQAALEAAERWLARAPVPLALIQSGRPQIPADMEMEADLRDLLLELARSDKKRTRKGHHVIAWSPERRVERFKMLPIRDAAELPRIRDFQAAFFASNDGQAALQRLAALQRERPKDSKSILRIQERLWRSAGDARLYMELRGHGLARYGFPDRAPSAAPRLMVCSKCKEIYAPRDRQDVGRCPQCGNAVRQGKHRQRVAKQPRGGDAMDRRALSRSSAGVDEWAPPTDRAPALDDWDSDEPIRLLIERCEQRGEKDRAADLRTILRKGVTP